MDITMIVLNYNDASTTKNLVQSVKQYNTINHIVVVDNNSTDESFVELERIKEFNISVIRTGTNGGYGYGNNFGIEYARQQYESDYYLICNPDVEFDEKTLNNILRIMAMDGTIVCASTIPHKPGGSIQSKFCWNVPSPLSAVLATGKILQKFYRFDWLPDNCCENKEFIEVDCVPGSFLVLSEKLIREGKVYDENMFLYYEETVLGYKIKQLGYKTIIVNDKYIHHHSVSINKSISSTVKQRKIMYESLRYFIKNYLNPSKVTFTFCSVYLKVVVFENYFDWIIEGIKGVIK